MRSSLISHGVQPNSRCNHPTDAWLNIPPKFIEALVNCRLGSGSDLNLEVDRKILATQLGLIGEDGLTYAPEGPLPKLKDRQHPKRGYSEIWGEGRLLVALSMLAQIDDDPRWVEIGRKKIDRLPAVEQREGWIPLLLERALSSGRKGPRRRHRTHWQHCVRINSG